MATLTRLRLGETRAGAKLLADSIFQRATAVVGARRPTRTPRSRLTAGSARFSKPESATRRTCCTRPSSSQTAPRSPTVRRRWRATMLEHEDFAPIVEAGTLEQLRAVYSEQRRFEIRQPMLRRAAVRRDPGGRVHVARQRRDSDAVKRAAQTARRRADRLDGRRDGAGAMDAPADPRHSERPEPAGSRRARRRARFAGRGVQGSRQLVRCGQRAAVRGRAPGAARRRRRTSSR